MTDRRDFLKFSAAGLAAAGSLSLSAQDAAKPEMPELKIALIGCGGRGSGAVTQALTANPRARVVAFADAFADRADKTYKNTLAFGERMKAQCGGVNPCTATPETVFVGIDAFQKAIDVPGVDLVILATPPGFRPAHLEYAVKAKKHVFMEKPVAVDAPGIRSVLASTELAKQNKTALAVGLQRRHEIQYRETITRLQDGAIGKIQYGRVFWNDGGVWCNERKPGQSEFDYQMRNWYYFNWLCGDHIAEQHIHNLDVFNWLMGSYPVKAAGMGGRQVRVGPDFGEIFDHHFVEFEYANGVRLYSQCRHQKGAASEVSEYAYGDKGFSCIAKSLIEGSEKWKFSGKRQAGHQQEWHNLMASLATGEIPNEGEYGAKSTMTAIFGRMATYSGKIIGWDEALASTISLAPDKLAWDAQCKVLPGKDGLYPCAIPGQTQSW